MFELLVLPDEVGQDGPVGLTVQLGHVSNRPLALLQAVLTPPLHPLNTVQVPGGAEPGLERELRLVNILVGTCCG